MSKYGESIGIWDLKVGGADLELKPQKGDNHKLMKIVTENEKNQTKFFEEMTKFIKGLIARDHPPDGEREENELDLYVEFNIVKLIEELMIKFRWTTRAQLEKQKDQEGNKIKNLLGDRSPNNKN